MLLLSRLVLDWTRPNDAGAHAHRAIRHGVAILCGLVSHIYVTRFRPQGHHSGCLGVEVLHPRWVAVSGTEPSSDACVCMAGGEKVGGREGRGVGGWLCCVGWSHDSSVRTTYEVVNHMQV